MKRRLYYDDNRGILLSILMIVLGLVMAIWPGHVMTTTLRLLGAALLVGGAIMIRSWYKGRMKGVDVLTLTEGILLCVAGVAVLAAPKFLISIVPLVAGVIIALNGVLNLAQALDQKREGYERWTISLALAVLTIVLGALVIFNPFKSMEMLVVALGVIIAYNGASNLLIEWGYKKMGR